MIDDKERTVFKYNSSPPVVQPQDDPQRLAEEIAYMEARLAEIGHDGDCAYEKAIIRFFNEQLEVRRARLRTI
jgi:hypothetical protein